MLVKGKGFSDGNSGGGIAEGRTVVEDECGAGGETGDEPMPHHPGAGCEVEEP